MAPPSFSPDTSTSSRTLSTGSQPPTISLQSTSISTPSDLLANPLTFLQPTRELNASFLAAAKRYLDPIAASVSESQSQRQQELRRKRKRGYGHHDDIRVLHLKKLHLDGFEVDQVYEQTRKIVDATAEEIELALPDERPRRKDKLLSEEDDDKGIEDDEEVSDLSEMEVDSADAGSEDLDQEQEDSELEDGSDIPDDGDMDALSEDGHMSSEDSDRGQVETYTVDPNGLNDGFFSIDDFNKATDFLEQQDQRGEAAESDDDEIDWATDPMVGGAVKPVTNGRLEDNSEEEDDEEDGPTFGNADLNAPDGDSEGDDELEHGDLDGLDDDTNANNIMYADFFAPPARKVGKSKKKRGRPNPHNFPDQAKKDTKLDQNEDEEMDQTMARVQRDLFEDDDDAESEALSDVDPSNPKSRRSTYERRQAKIAEEIRKLEAANVSKRNWQLSGEARAADRPLNSLLEENLDFERAGKPVPVITAEVSEDIESLIKRRILANEFDDLHRRRPDDLATGPRVRRGQFQLDDTKNPKGLAEVYEEEHLRQIDPNFVEAKDEKLKKEHDEIAILWKSVSAKLDSLSSSHFKPKPAVPNLEIRVDAPAIEMEDARPTAGSDVAGASMLAPQELYKPGQTASKSEVVTKSGMPLATDELSREQKARRRTRAKEKARKAGGSNVMEKSKGGEKKKKKKRDENNQMLADLRKGGVQIIGKRGVVTDLDGNEVREEGGRKGPGTWKL